MLVDIVFPHHQMYWKCFLRFSDSIQTGFMGTQSRLPEILIDSRILDCGVFDNNVTTNIVNIKCPNKESVMNFNRRRLTIIVVTFATKLEQLTLGRSVTTTVSQKMCLLEWVWELILCLLALKQLRSSPSVHCSIGFSRGGIQGRCYVQTCSFCGTY